MNDTLTMSPSTSVDTALAILKELFATTESRFASFVYRNKEGELSHYLVHLNVNYKKILQRDLKVLQSIRPETTLEAEALNEMISSLKETLETGRNSNYTKEDYYTHLTKSVKYHETTLYINCFVVSKTVLEPGQYKTVKHSEKTLAKNKFRKMMKQSKFREFRLDMTQIYEIRINGKVIEIV